MSPEATDPERAKFLESGQGYGRGGFASKAFGSDLSLGDGDLRFSDIEAPAAGLLNGPRSLAPRGRVANANGAGSRVRFSIGVMAVPAFSTKPAPMGWLPQPE